MNFTLNLDYEFDSGKTNTNKSIELFNSQLCNDKAICKKENKNHSNTYNYICNNNILFKNANVDEQIYLPNISHNMFISMNNQGRFGNYIYGALYAIMALLEFEKYFTNNKNYDNIVDDLKHNKLKSKLYSPYICRVISDSSAYVNDKYYFLKNGVDAFKYFTCHHINLTTLICNKDIDIECGDNNKIYMINGIIYFFFNINDIINIQIIKNSNDYFYFYNNQTYATIDNLIDNINNIYDIKNIIKNIKIINLNYKNKEIYNNKDAFINIILDIKEKHNKFNIDDSNYNILLNNYKMCLINELKKCFLETGQNKIICYNTHNLSYDYQLISNPAHNNFLLLKAIKDVLFEDNENIVQNIYNNIINVNTNIYNLKNKNFAIVHFRGGDFEMGRNDIFFVLKPQYYIDAIARFIFDNKFNEINIVLLCCFQQKDFIFNAYINIIKYNFPNIIVLLEDDLINIDPNCKVIFSNETKHILFMSLFKNMISSNSTYSQLACKININNDKYIIGSLACYNRLNNNMIKYCGMSLNTHTINIDNNIHYTGIKWHALYIMYYLIYDQYKNQPNIHIYTNDNTNIFNTMKNICEEFCDFLFDGKQNKNLTKNPIKKMDIITQINNFSKTVVYINNEKNNHFIYIIINNKKYKISLDKNLTHLSDYYYPTNHTIELIIDNDQNLTKSGGNIYKYMKYKLKIKKHYM